MIAVVNHARGTAAARRAPRGMPGRGVRRTRAVIAGFVLGFVGVLAAPASPASAHAVLVGTSPAQGSVIQTAPSQVVLTFTEGVTPIRDKVRVIAPDGSRADSGDERASGTQLIIALRPDGGRGTYLVTYRVLSADSHPVAGAFTYSVGAPSPGGPPTAADGDAATSPFITATFPIVRWIGYVGLLLLVGAVLVLALLWPQRLDRRGPVRMIWLGVALVAVATLLELAWQVPYITGRGPGDIEGADIREVLGSQYGAAHLVRLGVLAAALILVRPIVAGKGWGADRVLLAVLGTIGVATWSVSGHPSASSVPMVTVVADMIHISSMSVWIGGLVMLAVFLLPRATAMELSTIVPVWSRWATYAVSALVLTGVAQALVQAGSVEALVGTRYGWILITKLSLVGAVLLIASFSRRLVAPIAGGGEGGASRRLRAIVVAEAAVSAFILATTAVLVQTTPARSQLAESTAPTVQSALLRDELFILTLDVRPAKVGINEVHLYATTPDGQPSHVEQWLVRASMPAQGIEPIDASTLPITPDHAIGQIGLPTAGTWTFSFTLRTSEIDQSTVTTDIMIRP